MAITAKHLVEGRSNAAHRPPVRKQLSAKDAMHLGRLQAPVAVPAPVPGRLDECEPTKDGIGRAGPEGKAELDRIAVLIERARLEIDDGERPGQRGSPGDLCGGVQSIAQPAAISSAALANVVSCFVRMSTTLSTPRCRSSAAMVLKPDTACLRQSRPLRKAKIAPAADAWVPKITVAAEWRGLVQTTGEASMAVGNAVQRGGFVYVHDKKGRQLSATPAR